MVFMKIVDYRTYLLADCMYLLADYMLLLVDCTNLRGQLRKYTRCFYCILKSYGTAAKQQFSNLMDCRTDFATLIQIQRLYIACTSMGDIENNAAEVFDLGTVLHSQLDSLYHRNLCHLRLMILQLKVI